MRTKLETDQTTIADDSFRCGPKKSKNRRIPAIGLSAPFRRPAAHAALNKEYLRALRAAEMAVWESADRKSGSLNELPAHQPQAAAAIGKAPPAPVLKGLTHPACAVGAATGLIAAVGVLSRITDGVLRFAALVQQIVS